MSEEPRPRPETTIRAYRDGPLLVRGPVTIVDERGEVVERRRRTIALCRCGASRIKPYCDGTHRIRDFRAGAGPAAGPAAGTDRPL